MKAKERRAFRRLIAHLERARELADHLDLELANGGEVGALIGSIADELDIPTCTQRLSPP